MRLGYHVNVWSDAARGSVRVAHPPILKVLSTAVDRDELLRWRASVPDGVLIYRWYSPNNDLTDVAGRVNALLASMDKIKDLVTYVETPWNEAWQHGSVLLDYNAATLLAVQQLHDHGYHVLVGHFSVGNPPDIAADWPSFLPSLRAADGLSLHEYGRPTMQGGQGDLCLRYRHVYALLPPDCRKPLWITETGIDFGDPNSAQNGYQSHGGQTALAYANQLQANASELVKDSYVQGAVVFACGTYQDFSSFDVAGKSEIEKVIKIYGGSPMPTTFNVGPGVLALMAQHQDAPESDEHYIEDATGQVFKSETFGAKGLYQWSKQANKTVMLPFA